jgi:hypothetical protein
MWCHGNFAPQPIRRLADPVTRTPKTNFSVWCPGDFEQLPARRLTDPVTRTLTQALECGVPVTLSNKPHED